MGIVRVEPKGNCTVHVVVFFVFCVQRNGVIFKWREALVP